MIRREEEGKQYLIRQDDHAKLSGELARHIGHGKFEPLSAHEPKLAEKALAAIAMHDAGWPLHDDAPTLNPKFQPRDVFESKPEMAIKLWSASADRASAIDPYTGLLVSLHGMALSATVLNDLVHQWSRKQVAYTRERFDLNRFQHNEIERQHALRTQLGLRLDLPLNHGLCDLGADPREDLLIHHFRTLQAMDRLSLALCCSRSPFEMIDLGHRVGHMLARLKLNRDGRRLRVDPWPFDSPRLVVTVPAKGLPIKTYVGEAEFHALYAAAPTEAIEFELSSGMP